MIDMADQGSSDLIETVVAASAELVRRRDFSPMRLRRNGNLKKPMGLYFSVKLGDHLPWEAKTELKTCWWAEVSSAVLVYRAQPHTLRMVIDGRAVSYTPDFHLDLAGGGVQILEVKGKFDEAKDPSYSQKLARASAVYSALGYDFTVVDSELLEQEPAFSAVSTLQRYRAAIVDQREGEAVCGLLADGLAPLQRVLELVPEGPRGLAMIASMLVQRAIRLDLGLGLTRETPVWLVQPDEIGAPLFGQKV